MPRRHIGGMAKSAAKTATAQRTGQAPDPRFAALARLLARHAVRKELEKESAVSQDSDSPDEDAS